MSFTCKLSSNIPLKVTLWSITSQIIQKVLYYTDMQVNMAYS